MITLEQILPVVIKKKHMEPFGLGDGYDEEDAAAFYNFYQPFDNADGSGAIGGTTEDPTSKTFAQIIDGVCKGTDPGSTLPTANNTVVNTLTTPVSGGASILINLKKFLRTAIAGTTLFFIVRDSSAVQICKFRFGASGAANIIMLMQDKIDGVISNAYTTVAPLVPESGIVTLNINLTTKKLDILSDDWTLTSNTNLDISAGGAMTSTDVGRIDILFASSAANESMLDAQVDALTVFNL